MNKHKMMMSSLKNCEVNSMDAILFSIAPDEIVMSGTLNHIALIDFFETMIRADPNFRRVIQTALEHVICPESLH